MKKPILAVLLGLATIAPAAQAQARGEERPTPVNARSGIYGGGQLGATGQFVRLTLGRGRLEATQRATLTTRCGGFGAPLVENIRIAPIEVPEDGEFVIESEFNETIPPEVPRIGGLERTGLITGRTRIGRRGAASGTMRSRFVLRDPSTGRVRARCGTGLVRFSVRIPGRVDRSRSRPRRGASYFGLTGQRQPFLLRVAPGGRQVGSAGMAYSVGCASAAGRPLQIGARSLPIRRGRFDKRGRFEREYVAPDGVVVRESYRWRLAGRFGSAGASGLWRVIGVARRTDTGALVQKCDTSRNRWRARR
jgi:hypothetical protein